LLSCDQCSKVAASAASRAAASASSARARSATRGSCTPLTPARGRQALRPGSGGWSDPGASRAGHRRNHSYASFWEHVFSLCFPLFHVLYTCFYANNGGLFFPEYFLKPPSKRRKIAKVQSSRVFRKRQMFLLRPGLDQFRARLRERGLGDQGDPWSRGEHCGPPQRPHVRHGRCVPRQ